MSILQVSKTVRAIINPQAILIRDKRAAQIAKTQANNLNRLEDKVLNNEPPTNSAEIANLPRHLS